MLVLKKLGTTVLLIRLASCWTCPHSWLSGTLLHFQSLYCLLPTGPLPCGKRLVKTFENNSYCLLNLFERESIFRKKKRDNWKALYSSFSALGHWFFRCCNVLHGEMVPWTFIHISDSGAHSTLCKPFTFQDSVCLLVVLSDLNLFQNYVSCAKGEESRTYWSLTGSPSIPWYPWRGGSRKHRCSLCVW